MADLALSWASDLSISPTGDLLTVADPELGTERILRRLLTNPSDYIWNPEYGGGLGQFIGQPASEASVEALVRKQMLLEEAVCQIPEPIVTVTSRQVGYIYMQIHYVDSITAQSSSVATSILDPT